MSNKCTIEIFLPGKGEYEELDFDLAAYKEFYGNCKNETERELLKADYIVSIIRGAFQEGAEYELTDIIKELDEAVLK